MSCNVTRFRFRVVHFQLVLNHPNHLAQLSAIQVNYMDLDDHLESYMKFVPFCTHPGIPDFEVQQPVDWSSQNNHEKRKVSADDGATWRPWGPTLSRVHERSFLDESTMAWQGVTRGKNPQLPATVKIQGFEGWIWDDFCGQFSVLRTMWRMRTCSLSNLEIGILTAKCAGTLEESLDVLIWDRCCHCNWTRFCVRHVCGIQYVGGIILVTKTKVVKLSGLAFQWLKFEMKPPILVFQCFFFPGRCWPDQGKML